MTATVRKVEDNEFFTWLDLYAGYGEFYENPVTDEKALLVWSWITDSGNELEAYFAIDDEGNPVGVAHVREFVLRDVAHELAVEPVGARRRHVQAPQDVHQRALAAA